MHRVSQALLRRGCNGGEAFPRQTLDHRSKSVLRLASLASSNRPHSRMVKGRFCIAGDSSTDFEAILGISILSEPIVTISSGLLACCTSAFLELTAETLYRTTTARCNHRQIDVSCTFDHRLRLTAV
jgi:hypothetical protein